MHHFQNNSPYKRSTTWGRINGETIFGNWIKHKNFTFGHVASLTGASIRSVKYWAHGQALPSLLFAFKIDQISQGKVPVASWMDTAIAKAKWHNPHVAEKTDAKPREKKAHVVLPEPPQHSAQDPKGGVHSAVLRGGPSPSPNQGAEVKQAEGRSTKQQDKLRTKAGTSNRNGDEEAGIAGGPITSSTPGRRLRVVGKRGKA